KMQYPVDSKKHFCLCCGAVVEQNPGIKYLRTLGFQATNDIFAENAWYFRNALVRANYNNLVKGIHETTEFLELFLRNLLCDEQNELHNRSMHVSGVYKDFQKADIQTNKADIQSGKADIGKRKADVSISEIYGNRINGFSSKTVEHIQMMYAELGTKQFFGRVDVQSATKLGHTRASELIKELVNVNIIETVTGHGKGKYRFCD
ncbi:MAG TPA: hypothetical protein PLQ04_07035, partial [Lachnospiraceae bacterium]|nr:hypothetical protein [Lachnospiraceae bacterium]